MNNMPQSLFQLKLANAELAFQDVLSEMESLFE